ncbi:TPA: hypothetical protein ACPSKZ_000681 [Legionella anisa]|uniref:hypothetical protein n=1 Tax=Legionella anisa TaxID=28082 RepID=UPI002244A2CA|nr:hypothetical protein [Legionella anisa]MCW8425621.1 hypothetical protein [Legionella anisa]MCW8448950.1 hypothetical protein [Legionella anisa]
MTQIVRTTNELIINSLYLIGELGVQETPDAFMLSTGLELINELLDKFDSDSIYIPYLTELSFDMVVGQPTYSISDMVPADVIANRIVDLSFANYTVPSAGQGIIYPLQIINKAQYYGVTRLTPLNTRPGFIFLDKQPLDSFITLYPAPDQPYPGLLGVKLMLNSVEANQSLQEIPPFYYGFLKYSLARKFLNYYPSGNWNEQAEQEYQDYYNIIKNANETDLTVRPSAILSRPEPFYWQNILAY